MKAKPQPPADMWDRLGQEISELGMLAAPNHETSFCAEDLCAKYGMNGGQAKHRLATLLQHGRIRKIGIWKKRMYYEFVL